jgi:hypothetical protein
MEYVMSQVYAGTSAFFANRSGNHNWLDNQKRPFISLITTAPDGSKSYQDLFINDRAVDVKVAKNGKITLSFPTDISQPLFRVLDK